MTTTKGKLGNLAKERGVEVIDLVVAAIEKHGSILAAATALGVTPNTIQYHKKRNGLETDRKTTVKGEAS